MITKAGSSTYGPGGRVSGQAELITSQHPSQRHPRFQPLAGPDPKIHYLSKDSRTAKSHSKSQR